MAIEVKFLPAEIPPYLRARHGSLRALTPDEEDVLYVYGEQLRSYIVDAWPVDTGTSQDAFSFYTVADPGSGYGVVIENPMYYAEYVHRSGTAPEPPLFETLFPEAWRAVKPLLLAALFTAIDATEALRPVKEAAKVARGASVRGARAETSRELSRNPITALLKRLNPLL